MEISARVKKKKKNTTGKWSLVVLSTESEHQIVVCRSSSEKVFFLNFRKMQRKTPMLGSLFNKVVVGLQSVTLLQETPADGFYYDFEE